MHQLPHKPNKSVTRIASTRLTQYTPGCPASLLCGFLADLFGKLRVVIWQMPWYICIGKLCSDLHVCSIWYRWREFRLRALQSTRQPFNTAFHSA